MASTVKVPLLGTHSKGTVVGVGIGGFTIAGYFLYRQIKKSKADAAAAASASAQAASGYGYGAAFGYGYGSAYPEGYYGYGEGPGTYGYGSYGYYPPGGYYGYGAPPPPSAPQPPGGGGGGTQHQKVTVPKVTGMNYTRAETILKSKGLTAHRAEADVGIVTAQYPDANAEVDKGSVVALSGKGKKKRK